VVHVKKEFSDNKSYVQIVLDGPSTSTYVVSADWCILSTIRCCTSFRSSTFTRDSIYSWFLSARTTSYCTLAMRAGRGVWGVILPACSSCRNRTSSFFSGSSRAIDLKFMATWEPRTSRIIWRAVSDSGMESCSKG
jgi:hypothetical protein